jgi:hypothetical protein
MVINSFSNVFEKPSELFPRCTGIVKIRGHDYIDKIFQDSQTYTFVLKKLNTGNHVTER